MNVIPRTRVPPFHITNPDETGTSGLFMSERQPRPYDSVARKWHASAERRRAHVVELRESGRWQYYYTWDQLLEALREAANTRDTWARIAGLAEGDAQA